MVINSCLLIGRSIKFVSRLTEFSLESRENPAEKNKTPPPLKTVKYAEYIVEAQKMSICHETGGINVIFLAGRERMQNMWILSWLYSDLQYRAVLAREGKLHRALVC